MECQISNLYKKVVFIGQKLRNLLSHFSFFKFISFSKFKTHDMNKFWLIFAYFWTKVNKIQQLILTAVYCCITRYTAVHSNSENTAHSTVQYKKCCAVAVRYRGKVWSGYHALLGWHCPGLWCSSEFINVIQRPQTWYRYYWNNTASCDSFMLCDASFTDKLCPKLLFFIENQYWNFIAISVHL